jgi:glycosyltransferase involved in cell wall biosynthesis
MKKTRISWLTPDYFIDCDLNVIHQLALSGEYEIHWTVIFLKQNSRFSIADLKQLEGIDNLHIHYTYYKYRVRNPRNLALFYKLLKGMNRENADLIYIDHPAIPYFAIAAVLLLDKAKTIFTAHQGSVHSGFSFKGIFKASYKFAYSRFKYVQLFSEAQSKLFKALYPQTLIYTINLALKSFGDTNKRLVKDEVVFFNFGTIKPGKNIDLLIEAACNMYEAGVRGFRIVIAGSCSNWDDYQQKIRYPEIFTCDIRFIKNDEISDMFARYHYLVLPYRVVTQSGPLKIAFNYNTPVIASRIGSFADEMKDGVSGYLFEPENVRDLERVMTNAINTHAENYDKLMDAQRKYVNDNYSLNVIVEKYKSMFKSVNI